MAFTTKILKFACTASIIYRATFILISTGAPTEENHDVFLYLVFFIDTDVSQAASENREPSLVLSTTFTNIQILFSSFTSCLIHTNIYVCRENRNTRWLSDIINTYPKNFCLLVLTEARREIPGKHCSPNLCFSLFLISSLFYTKWSFKDYQTKCAAMF